MISASSQLQGFYPQDSDIGEILTEEQEKMAYPRVNVDDPEITEKIEGLYKAALPYRMTLAPIRMANDNDRKMNIFGIEKCEKERDKIRQKNIDNSPELKNYFQNFK